MHLTRIKIAPPGLYPPPCTLPSTVHCPVHLHTGPAPPVYTAFLLMRCQLKFELATMIFWGKFCTCSCLGENFELVPSSLLSVQSFTDLSQNQVSKTLKRGLRAHEPKPLTILVCVFHTTVQFLVKLSPVLCFVLSVSKAWFFGIIYRKFRND